MSKRAKIKRQIIKHLYFEQESSSTDLSFYLNKSVPFVNGILGELLEENIIEEHGLAISSGGRRPMVYRLKANLIYVMAVSVDQMETKMAIFDLHNHLIGDVFTLNLKLTAGSEEDLKTINHSIINFIEQHSVDKDKILGIGVGMPGFVDVNKDINHTFLNTDQGSIVRYMEKSIQLPVVIDNDSSLVALAELKFGQARGVNNAMTLNIGWGIGLGMVLNGNIFRGANGYAGEFSHIPLFDNQKLCQCGKRGCLETETSLWILIEKTRNLMDNNEIELPKWKSDISDSDALDIIIKAIRNGHPKLILLLTEIGYTLGRGISILMHLLNPSSIVISGRGAKFGKFWVASIQQAINEHCIPKIAENINIKISDLGGDASLIGAAALVIDKYDNLTKLEAKASIIQ